MDIATYEPHLIPVFDGRFNVRCLFDEEDVDDRPMVPRRPSYDSDSYSIQILDEDSDDSGAGASGLAAGFSDRHQNLLATAAISDSKECVQQKTYDFGMDEEGEFLDYMSTCETTDDSDSSLGSTFELDEKHQNASAMVMSAPDEFVVEDDKNSHLNEEGNIFPKETSKVSAGPSELSAQSAIIEARDEKGTAIIESVGPAEFIQQEENNFQKEEGKSHDNMRTKETTEDLASAFVAALNKPREQKESGALQSVTEEVVAEEFELHERHLPNPSIAGEESFPTTDECLVDTNVENTSSVAETSL